MSMKMEAYSRGKVVDLEFTISDRIPFGSYALDDPTTIKVTAGQVGQTPVLSNGVCTKSSTGKYYYRLQTEESWKMGTYYTKLTLTEAPYTDIDIDKTAFVLE